MGMFDWIRCEMDLPEAEGVPPLPETQRGGLFQTKDTPSQFMYEYTITADGKLVHLEYDYELTPEDELPTKPGDRFHGILGITRKVEGSDRVVEHPDFHQDLIFYHYSTTRGCWDYVFRFTDGVVTSRSVEYTPPITSARGEPAVENGGDSGREEASPTTPRPGEDEGAGETGVLVQLRERSQAGEPY